MELTTGFKKTVAFSPQSLFIFRRVCVVVVSVLRWCQRGVMWLCGGWAFNGTGGGEDIFRALPCVHDATEDEVTGSNINQIVFLHSFTYIYTAFFLLKLTQCIALPLYTRVFVLVSWQLLSLTSLQTRTCKTEFSRTPTAYSHLVAVKRGLYSPHLYTTLHSHPHPVVHVSMRFV